MAKIPECGVRRVFLAGYVDASIKWPYTSHMETISVSQLKTHLSAELKRIEGGLVLTVVDHKRPVATLSPIKEETLFVREAVRKYEYEPLEALIPEEAMRSLEDERKDSW